MKVLHVTTALYVGGISRFLVDLLTIQQIQHDVTLLVLQDRENHFKTALKQAGINIICLDVKNVYNPFITFKFAKIFKSFDVVHVHLFPSLYWASLASFFCNTPLVFTEHSTFNNRRDLRLFKFIERFIYSRYNSIVAISKEAHDQLISWLDRSNDDHKYIIINNGVNSVEFYPMDTVLEGPPIIFMHARFNPQKDQITVIKALTKVKSDVKLLLAGDGPTKSLCESIVTQLDLTDKVVFLGNRNDIPQLINRSMIGVQSSNFEGFGLSALEIMACGKPIIASDVEGFSQVVRGAGLVFPVGDYVSLACHIDSLLNDKELYFTIKDRCFKRACEYSILITESEYSKCYNKLVHG